MDPSQVKADSDEYLMQLVQQHDESAFSTLVQRHTQSIHAFVYRMCNDRGEAEDITQETFLRLWQRATQWQPNKVLFTTWLHQIARNLCIDRFRKQQSLQRKLQVSDEEPSDQLAKSVEMQEQLSVIQKTFSALPERQRTALILCQVQGWSQRDAAEVLNTTVNGIQSLIGRARRALRDPQLKRL